MANCLRMPMVSSPCGRASPSLRSPSRRNFVVINSSKIPMPPINPNDPLLSRLASTCGAGAANPDTILNTPQNVDTVPFMDLYESPKNMASPAYVERSASYGRRRRKSPPPDLPSFLMDRRIVFIGMPLVPIVSELIVAELLALQGRRAKEPIHVYINSTGTTRDDGEVVAMDTEGFAIYDAMMLAKGEIHTVCLGAASGLACLLLAAGTKGKRFMMPHAKALLQDPRIPPSGLMQASDVEIRANEVKTQRNLFIKLLAKHTGNSEETVSNAMNGPFYMDAMKAKEFGVIDKILWQGQESWRDEVGYTD